LKKFARNGKGGSRRREFRRRGAGGLDGKKRSSTTVGKNERADAANGYRPGMVLKNLGVRVFFERKGKQDMGSGN